MKNQEWMEERIWNFEYDLKNLASLSPYAAIHFIRKGIGYDEFLKTYADERNVNADDWFDVLDEMQEMARDKKSIPEFLSFVENYGDTLEEMRQEQKKQQVKEEPGVSLMTMHASKGLEFPVVFVPTVPQGCSRGKFRRRKTYALRGNDTCKNIFASVICERAFP